MRWVIGIVGVLVVIVAVILVVGALLPKAHVASRSARYAASPDTLWGTLINAKAFPTWRTELQRVETLPDENGQRGWREYGKDGVIPYRVIESVPRSKLVTRIADPKLPFGGTWTYDLVPDGTGTRLTITERGEVYNPIFRFVSRFFMGSTSTMDGFLRSLGTKHGKTVTPESAAVTV